MDKELEKKLYELIGIRINKGRIKKGYTQKELADLVDLTRTSIVNIEKGRQRLPLHILFPIAMHLEIEPAELIPSIKEVHSIEEDIERIEYIRGQSHLRRKEKESIEALIKKAKNT